MDIKYTSEWIDYGIGFSREFEHPSNGTTQEIMVQMLGISSGNIVNSHWSVIKYSRNSNVIILGTIIINDQLSAADTFLIVHLKSQELLEDYYETMYGTPVMI